LDDVHVFVANAFSGPNLVLTILEVPFLVPGQVSPKCCGDFLAVRAAGIQCENFHFSILTPPGGGNTTAIDPEYRASRIVCGKTLFGSSICR
jgi:hypothetical protein